MMQSVMLVNQKVLDNVCPTTMYDEQHEKKIVLGCMRTELIKYIRVHFSDRFFLPKGAQFSKNIIAIINNIAHPERISSQKMK